MHVREKVDHLFLFAENTIYFLIGIILMIAMLFLLYDVALTFFNAKTDLVREIVEIVDKTLLMLMIVEILYTIRVSLKEHALNAEPFIVVGMIAGIRRILIISVETAYLPEKFKPHMIEISILGVLIFIFVVSMILMRKRPAGSARTPGWAV